jgi:DNA polymerase-3 subunit delta
VSKAALQTVRDAIKRGAFEPAYYIFGEDDFQKEDAVKQLQLAALDPGTRDFNLETRRGSELDGETLSVLLSTPPMMAERRVMVIRDVGAMKKESRKALDAYLAKPASDLLLLLTTPAGGKIDDALSEACVPVKFDELSGDRLPKWISHTAATAYGIEISPEAVELLQSSVGNDLYQLSTELDKLASYTGGNAIDQAAVSAIVGVIPGETITDFLDALGVRDLSKSLPLVPLILSQPKTTGVSIVMALSTQMLAIAWGQARLAEGATKGVLAKEYFDMLKKSGAFPGRPWGSASTAWTRAAGNWRTADVERVLDVLLDADIALKESRISSEEQLISSIVLAICAADGLSAAA